MGGLNVQNLKPIKPGEVRNPKGINGWTKLRERARQKIEDEQDDLMKVLFELAKAGDVQALSLALKPVLNVNQQEHSGADGEPLEIRWKDNRDDG